MTMLGRQFCTIYNYNTTAKFIRNPYYPQVVIKLKKYSFNLIIFWTKSAILGKQMSGFGQHVFWVPYNHSPHSHHTHTTQTHTHTHTHIHTHTHTHTLLHIYSCHVHRPIYAYMAFVVTFICKSQ